MTLLDNWFTANPKAIPRGLIIFFNGASVPSGWEAFADANDKMIIGAGNTYEPGDNGGDDVVVDYASSFPGSVGDHNNVSPFYNLPDSGGSGGPIYTYNEAAGDHTHDLGNATYVPAQNALKLIKALEYQNDLPIDAVMLGASAFSGLTNILTDSKYLAAAASIGAVSEVKSLAVSAAGAHTHKGSSVGQYAYGGDDSSPRKEASGGNHSPDIDLTITDNLKRVLLSVWTHASQRFDAKAGMIAMWERTDRPPPGFAFCDGQDGRPDLRDCFIKGVADGSENTTPSGDHTVSIGALSGSITHTVSHNHNSSDLSWALTGTTGSSIDFDHSNYSWVHNHTISEAAKNDISWLPPYFALSFVQKIRD